MDNKNDYHISFFKPTTERAKANRNKVLMLFLIWVVAIFGFQTLLKIVSKPTPEPAYSTFEKVWGSVQSGNASDAELKDFAKSTLQVLGKVFVDEATKASLGNAFSWSVYQLADKPESLLSDIKSFEARKEKIDDVTEKAYVVQKNELGKKVNALIGLDAKDPRSAIAPLELVSTNVNTLENKEAVEAGMKKYLFHNRSFLTDTRFLGFPFHYFYTAVFLLILFVGLCWLYCIQTDRYNKANNIEE